MKLQIIREDKKGPAVAVRLVDLDEKTGKEIWIQFTIQEAIELCMGLEKVLRVIHEDNTEGDSKS